MIRVLTWNLAWQFCDWEDRQDAIDAEIVAAEADLIGLQETWPEQVDRIAALTGFHSFATPPREGKENRFGNAVLSRWPILETDSILLPAAPGHTPHRSCVLARIEGPDGVIPFASTHLDHLYDHSAVRAAQLAEVCELVARHRRDPDDYPPIVVGDLNAVPDSDEIRSLTGRSVPYVEGLVFSDVWEQVGEGSGITWDRANPHLREPAWPQRRLDYVLVAWPRPRPAGNPISARLVGVAPINGIVPSDHYGLLAQLRTRASPSTEDG